MSTNIQYPFKNDHEVFIALIQDFNNSVSNIEKSVNEDHGTTLQVKELVEKQYDQLSKRISEVEKQLLELNPEELNKLKDEVHKSTQFMNDYNRTRHLIKVIILSTGLIIGSYLPNLILTLQRIFFAHK